MWVSQYYLWKLFPIIPSVILLLNVMKSMNTFGLTILFYWKQMTYNQKMSLFIKRFKILQSRKRKNSMINFLKISFNFYFLWLNWIRDITLFWYLIYSAASKWFETKIIEMTKSMTEANFYWEKIVRFFLMFITLVYQ